MSITDLWTVGLLQAGAAKQESKVQPSARLSKEQTQADPQVLFPTAIFCLPSLTLISIYWFHYCAAP